MTQRADRRGEPGELGRHAGDRALGEAGRVGGSGHSTCGARRPSRGRPVTATKPASCSTMASGSSTIDRRRADRRAPRRARSAASSAARRQRVAASASSAAGSATTRMPGERLKREHGGPPGRRTASASRRPRGRRSSTSVRRAAAAAASRASAPCRAAATSSCPSRCRRSRRPTRSACPRSAPAPSIVKPTQRRVVGQLGRPLERRPADEATACPSGPPSPCRAGAASCRAPCPCRR